MSSRLLLSFIDKDIEVQRVDGQETYAEPRRRLFLKFVLEIPVS